jgi:hypothetical protein
MKPFILSIITSLICQAEPLTITDIQGRTIRVDILGLADGNVRTSKADGVEFTIPLVKLSPESQKAVIAAGEAAAAAQPTSAPAGAKITVVSNAIGKVTDKSWETSWGSYDKDVYRSRAVVVTVVSDYSGQGILEVHWLGSEAGRASNKGVVIFSKKEITLVAREPQSHEFAALFVESDANYEALDQRDRSGLKYAGWVARLISKEGRQLAITAARPPLINQIGKPDPNQKEFPEP